MDKFKQMTEVELQVIEGGKGSLPFKPIDPIRLGNKVAAMICSAYQGFVGAKYKNGC